jgi:hypothetical protein
MFDRLAIRCMALAGLTIALLAPLSVEAQNQSRQWGNRPSQQYNGDYGFALTCVSTHSGDTVYFEYRWGEDDEWADVTAEPDQWQQLMWKYDQHDQGNSPQLQVRFDDDMSRGENYVITDLESYAATSEDCEGEGKTYHFEDRNGELFVTEDPE